MLAIGIGHEVFFVETLVGDPQIVLIGQHGLKNAGLPQEFDMLGGRRVGEPKALGQRRDVFAMRGAQSIDDLPTRDRGEDRTKVGHTAAANGGCGKWIVTTF